PALPDRLERRGVVRVARQLAETGWRSNTAKALAHAMLAKDPKRAAEMLGTAPAAQAGGGETTGADGTGLSAENPNGPASGDDRLADLTPDDRVALARLAGVSVTQN
ncbi:hypothetical protein, partial [Mesorhizobium sp.]|uniref:hypothetical protein n=1 Tax=Mesorhizobium sp. TaxID=1871066 RepID=UPI00257EBABF